MNDQDKDRTDLVVELHDLQLKHVSMLETYDNEIKKQQFLNDALSLSETHYRRMFESAKEGILILDAATGMIKDVNPYLMELIGYSKEQLIEKEIWKIGFFKDITANKDKFLELQKKKYVRYTDLPLETAVGRKIDVEFVSNVYAEGIRDVIQCNIRDVSDRIEAERELTIAKEHAEESDQLKSAFLANISHEIRTPLNGIMGFASLLQRSNLTGQMLQKYIHIIEKSGLRMLGVINDIIEISKIESGQVEIKLSETNVNAQLNNVYTSFKTEAKDKGLQFYADKTLSKKDALIITDNKKLNTILANLIKNAIKFTSEGSIEIGCEKKDTFIEFFVNDTGIGIAKENQEAIFERFLQVDVGDRKTYAGAGLGLSVAKAYVKLMGGEIRLESEENKGSKFIFTLPMAMASEYSAMEPIKSYYVNLRRQAEDMLSLSEIRYRRLFESTKDGILILDAVTGMIKNVNPILIEMLGYSKEQFIEKEIWEIGFFKDIAANKEKFIELQQMEFVRYENLPLETATGAKICVEFISNVYTEGHHNLIQCNIRDITERKRLENMLLVKNEEIETQIEEFHMINEELIVSNVELSEAKEHAEESDQFKTSFLQNMSHEIRTPMNAIMGFSGLLAENYNNKPKLEKFSEIITQRCVDLLDIINDILDIAKIESGQLTVNMEECNLNDLFLELSTFFTEHQERSGKQYIDFSIQVISSLTANYIITDIVKLKQIFINLIGNAFKFTKTGYIKAGCKFDIKHNLVFYVMDTGIGIPQDKLESVFDRFEQIHQETLKNSGGTGLGLSIVKGLVGLLGGNITLESEVGKGSTFTFTIAYKIPTPSLSSKKTIVVTTTDYYFPGKTVLIVEDDYCNAEFLKEIIMLTGVEIAIATLGKEAIQIALSREIDLILMDVRLPDMKGYEASQQILLGKPAVKIIAQTAYASAEERQTARDAGCIDYISKPTNREQLLSMLKKYLA